MEVSKLPLSNNDVMFRRDHYIAIKISRLDIALNFCIKTGIIRCDII